jgi:hypothetical protein
MSYKFLQLDPRPLPVAEEKNAEVLGANTLGIEVTISALAARCGLGNIDPQHTGGDAVMTAIEVALTAELPPEGSILVTIRADLDALGAMAVFSLRARGESLEPAMARVSVVAAADKFARGGYPGPTALPTRDFPWPEGASSVESSRILAAINAAVGDFKVSMDARVATMETWLLSGEEPEQYREQVEQGRLSLITALQDGTILRETRANGRIAVVVSTHRAATMVGYSLAPVVVALNSQFGRGLAAPYKKFTICAFEAHFADIRGALGELAELEPGWGGSPTIGGSPQGSSSNLTIDQVVGVVEKHLK